MRVVFDYPPIYSEIVNVFPAAKQKGVIFTYGDTIYNPNRVHIPKSLMAHEEVHSKRHGDQPSVWWAQYMINPKFRLKEEALAHQREYQVEIEGLGRPARRKALSDFAKRLCSPLYGGLVSYEEAKELIKGTEADIDAFLETIH